MPDTLSVPVVRRLEDSVPAVDLLPRSARRRPFRRVAAVALILLVLAGIAAGWASGLRCFVIESPSMGAAAPVGSLVLGTTHASPVVGDLITFRPPGAGVTPYTHRIVAQTADGFRTRGDINGAADPWTVETRAILSETFAVLPGVGWLVKAAPVLLAALVLAQVVGLFIRGPAMRWSIRTAAVAVAVAFISWTMKPFSGFVLLTSSAADEGMRATVVSTALLPIRISAVDGGHVDLMSGEVGRLLMPRGAGGHVTMASQLDLGPVGWAVVALLCLLPVIAVLAIGVPIEERDAAA